MLFLLLGYTEPSQTYFKNVISNDVIVFYYHLKIIIKNALQTNACYLLYGFIVEFFLDFLR